MAEFLRAKAPADAVEYRWAPNIGESLVSATLSVSGAVIDTEELTDSEVAFFLSGGTAGQTATVTVSVETTGGTEYSETLYIPIVASEAQIVDTAREYVNFALRKITGPRRSPSAAELDDGLDHLQAMIAEMRAGGADVGAPFPLTADSVIYCPDWAVSALRYNLRVRVMDLYGIDPGAMDFDRARRGLQLVKHKGLPAERISEFF